MAKSTDAKTAVAKNGRRYAPVSVGQVCEIDLPLSLAIPDRMMRTTRIDAHLDAREAMALHHLTEGMHVTGAKIDGIAVARGHHALRVILRRIADMIDPPKAE